jgi:hypothetical protein
MTGHFDISRQDVKTQLLFHLAVLLATLLASGFICFGVLDVSFPFAIFKWVAFITLGKVLYFIAAYVLFGRSFVDPLEKMYEDSRSR